MLNQTSFRLKTTLLPTDMSAKTTPVINKKDENGEAYFPSFTNETVVLTNEDRTVMETTKASCREGILSFSKRGLSDDQSETVIEKRKLTRNPGSLCFITYGAGDAIDTDTDNTWYGKQTYVGDMVSRGKAIYDGKLITKGGIEYPAFRTLEELRAYTKAFAGMFAILEADGELYKYNANTRTWGVVTTNNPTEVAKASKTTQGIVRIATDTEFANGEETGSDGAMLVANPKQIGGGIKKASETTAGVVRIATRDEMRSGNSEGQNGETLVPSVFGLSRWGIKQGELRKDDRQVKLVVNNKGETVSDYFYMPYSGFFVIKWLHQFIEGKSINRCGVLGGATPVSKQSIVKFEGNTVIERYDVYWAEKGSRVTVEFGATQGEHNRRSIYNNANRAIVLTDCFYIGV